jgi:hypothetical protein
MQIMVALRDLAARFHRYLHQDEFGPTRAERMAALRLLLDQIDLLVSRLNGLPHDLRVRLSEQLSRGASDAEPDIDNFQAYRHDTAALQQIAEAAIVVERLQRTISETRDAELMADLSDAARRASDCLCALDTTTAAAVAIDSKCPALDIGAVADDLIGFTIVCARVVCLQHRAGLALGLLECRGGPERFESLRWLVWQLCDLYNHETGRRVTNSADDPARCYHSGSKYTGMPRSAAGRFVLAAAKALQPSQPWMQTPDHQVAQKRVRLLDEPALARAVYFAIREYVAHNPPIGRRRGRPKQSK